MAAPDATVFRRAVFGSVFDHSTIAHDRCHEDTSDKSSSPSSSDGDPDGDAATLPASPGMPFPVMYNRRDPFTNNVIRKEVGVPAPRDAAAGSAAIAHNTRKARVRLEGGDAASYDVVPGFVPTPRGEAKGVSEYDVVRGFADNVSVSPAHGVMSPDDSSASPSPSPSPLLHMSKADLVDRIQRMDNESSLMRDNIHEAEASGKADTAEALRVTQGLLEQLKTRETLCERLRDHVASLEDSNMALLRQKNEVKATLQGEIDEKSAHIARLEAQLEQTPKRQETVQPRQLEALTQQVSAMLRAREEMEDELETKDEELDAYRAKLARMEAQQSTATPTPPTDTAAHFTLQIDSLTQQVSVLMRQKEEAEAAKTHLEALHTDTPCTQCTEHQNSVRRLEAEVEALKGDAVQKEEELVLFREQVEKMVHNLEQQYEEEAQARAAERREWEAKVDDITAHFKSLSVDSSEVRRAPPYVRPFAPSSTNSPKGLSALESHFSCVPREPQQPPMDSPVSEVRRELLGQQAGGRPRHTETVELTVMETHLSALCTDTQRSNRPAPDVGLQERAAKLREMVAAKKRELMNHEENMFAPG